ncbi:MAG: hypothetical protein ABI367_05495 [Mucilaginibacter sp.]
MNNTFDIKRFSMLFKKHTQEQGKTYLLSAGVLTGFMFLLFGFFSYSNDGHLPTNLQIPVFIFMSLIAGGIFTSIVFSELGDKSKAIPALMLPASHFEKYLIGWMYSYLIFQVVYVGVFYLTAGIIVSMGHHELEVDKVINIFDTQGNQCWYAFVMYSFIHAFAFFGAIFFKKLHFIKTAIAFFICLIILIIINNPIINAIIPGVVKSVPFQQLAINEHERYISIWPTENMVNASLCVLALVVLLLWTATYLRVKEKEV